MTNLSYWLAFFGGLGTAFTPCVYPLLPVSLGIIGAKQESSTARRFALSCAFLAGLALVYSILGYLSASSGLLLGSITQSPWLVFGMAFLFLLMGLALLDLVPFRIPSSVLSWVSRFGGAGYRGAFLLGAASGLIAAPCSGPIVVGILAYVAQKADPLRGFLLLFSFSLGVGTPFVVLGTASKLLDRLPRSGLWMVWVKHLCGLAMIAGALLFVRPYLAPGHLGVIAGIGIFLAGLLSFRVFPAPSGGVRLGHGVILAAATIVSFVVYLHGSKEAPLAEGAEGTLAAITWIPSETEGLKKAASLERPAVIDFFADWCVACHELEDQTYSDARVAALLREKFVPIKIDATDVTPDIQKLVEKYQVYGLPTVLFIKPSGKVCTDLTLTGFLAAEEFLELLNRARSC